jgi:predicted RND superfamily exporter protein
MKNIAFLFLAIFLFIGLFSCVNKTENATNNKIETPIALQDDKSLKNYSTIRSNLTEELYQELVTKSPELKKLEEDLETNRPKSSEINDKFSIYNNKSEGYYTSTERIANSISDSLLRNRIITILLKSKDMYAKKTDELTSLLKQISINNLTLSDHHLVLKILLTLPVIGKYQTDNLPDQKEIRELMKEQENLIKQLDKLTPKY